MSEDRDVQDWFTRTVEELPREPFTRTLLAQVQRSERYRQMQRSAALLVTGFSLGLLLPELIPLFYMLATLPAAISGEHLLWLAPPAAALGYWFFGKMRPARWLIHSW